MNKNISKKLAKSKKKISKKLDKRDWSEQPTPMFKASNIQYELDGRLQGVAPGGIGLIHMLAKKTGLLKEIDKELELLKRHLPYHESDHVANMAYNILAGGTCLQDIELLRNNEAWLNALEAEVIPDPTTAGDFLRRFSPEDIVTLMDVKNTIRKKIWGRQPKNFKKDAIINIDGTINETTGECKQGMDISYDGRWGYAPLVVSLDKTREPLYIINRSGNAPSHLGSARWVDKALDLLEGSFERLYVRGDTDFSLTTNFDKWDQRCTFIFGMDARKNLIAKANALSECDWHSFEKEPRRIKTEPRKRPDNIKLQMVKKRKFKRIETACEHISEFEYMPGKCQKPYRMIVLRKTINEYKGERLLFDDIRYFFYITNDWKKTAKQLVEFYRKRADHENDIDQLKHGVHAMDNPSDSLNANWAYMVIASLAWDLKAWYGMMMPYRALGLSIVRMEFKRFIQTFINIPCLIIRSGRAIKYRIIGYNNRLISMFKFFNSLKTVRVT
nr:IS1380 family transposase [uncultured Desulfobacter sp.]